MEILVVRQSEVQSLLSMEECIEIMRTALITLAHDEALVPLRSIMWLPQKVGALATMPAYLGHPHTVGVKVISVFPGNLGTNLDAHQGAILLFDPNDGRLLAVIDATEVTAIRTAAVSAVATDVLARQDASRLAILGSGTQARAHLRAMLEVRSLQSVRVWSRTFKNARRFAEEVSDRNEVTVEVMAAARDAVDRADLICTTTSAREPILFGDWLSNGAHINAVGSSVPFARELDSHAVAQCALFVDRRESALNEAGDFLLAKEEGRIDDSHIRGEIGDILIGKVDGRHSAEETTLFKSLGLAIEDVACAQFIFDKAKKLGKGTIVELSGS